VLSRRAKRRAIVYGGLIAALWGFWIWQPWEFDLFPRAVPNPHPRVDPDSAALFSRRARVMVVTAHPDDSEFYVGGTLMQLARAGADLTHVVVTDGDKGYYPFEDEVRNRRVRRAEQREASGRWKAREVVFLGFEDGRLQVTEAVIEALVREIRRLSPDYVLVCDPLYPPRFSHRDHRRSGTAVEQALRRIRGPKWLLRFSTRAPNFVVDITDDWEGKRELLAIHRSQFFGERLKRVENLVASFAETDGERIGVPLGEGFRCTQLSP
jgi:LmbE family N-acetylglucosaminyl deacetylase